MATDSPDLIRLQAPVSAPHSEGLATGTNLVLPPLPIRDRLSHLPEEVYDLSPSSHMVRLISAIIGDAGLGQLRKRMLMARLQRTINGSHFYDLDRFWGALFGVRRTVAEILSFDPTGAVATPEQWEDLQARDASYRSRIEQFTRAMTFGGSPTGMELMAEAILSVDCDVYESFAQVDRASVTYGDLEAFTYAELEAFTYADLEGRSHGEGPLNRWEFTIRPRRPITPAERYDLLRVINRLKPASTRVRIDEGIAMHEEAEIQAFAADSEHWEIHERQDDRFLERPPFSGYQGAVWSYNGEIAGVTAYADGWLPGETPERTEQTMYRLPGGSWLTYRPEMSLMPIQDHNAGSIAGDGQMVAHPYTTKRLNGDGRVSGDDSIAPVFLRGTPIEDVDPDQLVRRPVDLGMWVTPVRDRADRTTEVVEYRFSAPRLINTIDFEVSHYPCDVVVERYDTTRSAWVPIYTQNIYRSVPQYLPVTRPTGSHHLHWSSNHWVKRSARPSAGFHADRIRITMQRHGFESGPIMSNKRIPYSLALRNVNIGYRVTGKEAIPRSLKSGNPLSTTTDPYGRPVDYVLTTQPASGLLSGRAWKSEPQPVPNAVVSLYVDMRDDAGEATKIDRFYINPTYTGVHFKLYHSDDEPDGVFQAGDDPIPYGGIEATGGVSTDGGILRIPIDDAVTIDNKAVRFDIRRTWMLAFQFIAPVDSTSPEIGNIGFGSTGRFPDFTSALNLDMIVPALNLDFTAGSRVGLIFQYDAVEQTLTVWSKLTDGTLTSSSGPAPPEPNQIVDQISFTGFGSVESIVMKQNHEPLDDDAVDALLANLTDYPTKGEFLTEDDGGTDNAILRFHPSFVSAENILGFVGGPPDYWDELAWTPIARDYTTQKGYVTLPPTSAKFWKLEFTNLAAQVYESIVPITRHVKVYPVGEVLRAKIATGVGSPPKLASYERYLDSLAIVETSDEGRFNATDYRPTSALYATDTSGRLALQDLSWIYAFSPWHQGSAAPSFTNIQPHVYSIQTVVHSNKLAFFAGIKELRAYKVSFEADDDTPVYRERFLDSVHLETDNAEEPLTWDVDPGQMRSGSDDVIAYSRPYMSAHNVRAVQFATQQTPPVQLLPDDTFQDPILADSDFSDPALWHAEGDALLSYRVADRTIIVRRSTDPANVNLFHDGGLVQLPVHPPFAAPLGISASVDDADAMGGLSSPQVAVSPEGEIHAAVRVALTEDLDQPLSLEIIGVDGQILASKEVNGRSGNVIEEIVSYRLGSQPALPTPSGEWGFRSIVSPPVREVFAGGEETVLYSGPIDYEAFISDSFDRADDTELGDTDGGDAGDPRPWTYPVPGFEVGLASNAAVSLTTDPAFAVLPTDYGNGRVSASLAAGHGGLIFRFVDIDNHWIARTNIGGTVELMKVEAGVSTSIDTETAATVEVTLSVELNGDDITVLVDGVEKLNYTDDFLAGTSTAGFYVEDDTSTVQSWAFERPVGVPVYDDPDSQVSVRIVQRGSATNQWKVQALSLFDESIVWEFSNDDGQTWIPAHRIRNNPRGVLSFPAESNILRWRVKGFREHLSITSLQIRPWYVDRLQLRTASAQRGPNVSVWDQDPPIDDDPEFKLWSGPVPRSWFLAGKRYPSVAPDGRPIITPFARFYARTAEDDLTGITDAVDTEGSYSRYGYDVYDPDSLPHEVPGSEMEIEDDVSRSGGSFSRSSGTDVFSVEDSVTGEVTHLDGPIIKPTISPPG